MNSERIALWFDKRKLILREALNMYLQVAAALIIKRDKILVAQRKIGGNLGGYWEFPGGKIEKGETKEECLVREVKEELNIDIQILSFFSTAVHKSRDVSVALYTFWAKWIDGTMKLNNHEKIAWLTPSEMEDFSFLPADIQIIEKLGGITYDI